MGKTLTPPPPPTDAPRVVYHVAQMGDWRHVVNQQLRLLREVGLYRNVRITFLGNELVWLKDRCVVHGVQATIVRHDDNLAHCETLAMLEIQEMVKSEDESPILYFHTKGVSAPGHQQKADWRRFMEEWVIRRWRENVTFLADHDAVGVSWWEAGEQHFSGNFWLANPSWIRKLPDFIQYHWNKGGHRYSCEMWIGSHQWCKARSVGLHGQILSGFDFTGHIPAPPPQERELPVTVVIPTIPPRMNALLRAVESVDRQTVGVKKIVEVDCSHKGALATRNAALARVDTEWVAFLDDDDELHPDHVELLYNCAVENDADMVYPMWQVLAGDEVPQMCPLGDNLGRPFDASRLRQGNFIPVTVLVKTDLLRKVGGFQNAPGTDYEDYGAWLALLNSGAKIVHLPEVTWKYFMDAGSTKGLGNRW